MYRFLYFRFRSHDDFHTNDAGVFVGDSPKYADQRSVFNDLGQGVLDNALKGKDVLKTFPFLFELSVYDFYPLLLYHYQLPPLENLQNQKECIKHSYSFPLFEATVFVYLLLHCSYYYSCRFYKKLYSLSVQNSWIQFKILPVRQISFSDQ